MFRKLPVCFDEDDAKHELKNVSCLLISDIYFVINVGAADKVLGAFKSGIILWTLLVD